MTYNTKPVYPLWRSLIFPIFYLDQLKMPSLAISVCLALGMAFANYELSFTLFLIWYAIFALSMRHFVPYSIEIEQSDIVVVETILDNNKSLYKCSSSSWRPVRDFLIFSSKVDIISIQTSANGIVIIGRKDNIKSLCFSLHERTSVGEK